MERTIARVRRLAGEVTVPGELAPAQQQVLLAAMAAGDGQVANTPEAVCGLVEAMRALGVDIDRTDRLVQVRARGPQGLVAPAAPLDLAGMGPIRQALLGALAAQPSAFSARLGPPLPGEDELFARLQAMGAPVLRQDGIVTVGGGAGLTGVEHDVAGLPGEGRLGLLLAGLSASGATVLSEPEGQRSRLERLLRERQVPVECRRDDSESRFRMGVDGGRALAATQVTLGGDLALAYPYMVMALPRRRSQLELRGVALRPANRGLLDLLRQMGATVRLAGRDDETADIAVQYTAHLRATRVAGERAARLLPQLPLVAVLATQCTGEFVLRDLQALRQGPTDRVAVLYSLLKSLGAHVAEYEQGLVVRGGTPLDGCRLDCGGDPELALACGAAGALAHGETTIAGVECLGGVYPDFFATVELLSR